MESHGGETKETLAMTSSEEDKAKNDLSRSLELPQQWQISGDLKEFMSYIKYNPVHCPLHAQYAYKLWKYYRNLNLDKTPV